MFKDAIGRKIVYTMPQREKDRELVMQYLEETAKLRADLGSKSIVLMQVGSFYEVYALRSASGELEGGDVEAFAKLNCMKVASKGHARDGREILMAGFGMAQVDTYVDRTVAHGYTIAIHDQETNAPKTDRSCARIVSPGTILSDSDARLSNTIGCLWVRSIKGRGIAPATRVVAGALLDVHTGQPVMFQARTEDRHDPVAYDELERRMAVHRPAECIIVHNLGEKGDDLPAYAGCLEAKVHLVDEGGATRMAARAANACLQTYQLEALNQFYSDAENVFNDTEREYDLALQALVLLLDFAKYHGQGLTKSLSSPLLETNPTRLYLGNHSLLQLNLIGDSRCSGRYGSVERLLNQCVTPMGERAFTRAITSPTTVSSELEEAYNRTTRLLEREEWRLLRAGLSEVGDIDKIKRMIAHGTVKPKGVVMLADSVTKVANVARTDRDDPERAEVLLSTKTILDHLNGEFNLKILGDLDGLSAEELGRRPPEELAISAPGVDSGLDTLIDSCTNGIAKLHAVAAALSDETAKTEKRKNGHSVPLVKVHETAKSPSLLLTTERRAKNLNARFKRSGHAPLEISFSGGTFSLPVHDLEYNKHTSARSIITSPLIRHLTLGSQEFSERLTAAVRLFWRRAGVRLMDLSEEIAIVSRYAARADVAQCRAHVAHKFHYCRPSIVERERAFFQAKDLRHPLIEHLSEREIYVTNDLSLGGEDQRGMLLYGTNAVGKTSLIRAVGLSIILAQAGMFVPCSEFVFSPYTSIYTRILGNDNIFKGLSTFAVEMAELRAILRGATKDSLVLGDELCSGTESASAVGIFAAGLEDLHTRQSTFMFATHMHEITRFDEIKALDGLSVKHLQVRYDAVRDVLVYDRKLRDGPGRAQYGLEVCKSLGLPGEFLERAQELRGKYAGEAPAVLDESASRYNAKKLRGNCESCGVRKASQVHHLRHQAAARKDNGYIGSFHKNHKANLMSVCDCCHDKFHETDVEHRVVKTTGGYIVQPDR